MKLSPAAQQDLLELATLVLVEPESLPKTPEELEVERLTKEYQRANDAAASLALSISDMEAEVRRIQRDTAKLQRREADAKGALGATTDPERRRELQHELAAAVRRIDDLRGELKETHDELHALRAHHERYGAELDSIQRSLAAAQRAIVPRDTASRGERIDELRAVIDTEALAEYDEQFEIDGVGAAKFIGRSCGGCHLILPPATLSAITNAPAESVPRCPDCGVYLIR